MSQNSHLLSVPEIANYSTCVVESGPYIACFCIFAIWNFTERLLTLVISFGSLIPYYPGISLFSTGPGISEEGSRVRF